MGAVGWHGPETYIPPPHLAYLGLILLDNRAFHHDQPLTGIPQQCLTSTCKYIPQLPLGGILYLRSGMFVVSSGFALLESLTRHYDAILR